MEKKSIIDVYLETVLDPEERPEYEAFFDSLEDEKKAFIIQYMEDCHEDGWLDQLDMETFIECRDCDDPEDLNDPAYDWMRLPDPIGYINEYLNRNENPDDAGDDDDLSDTKIT